VTRRRPREWWETHFDAQYLLEYQPIFSERGDRREVSRLIDVLGLPIGARLLDAPCGQGRHARVLVEAGYDVTGLDYSRDLLAAARRYGPQRRLRYVRGDMRDLPSQWTGRFDAVLNLFTSFGFFLDSADDARVIAEFARVLRPNGTFVWHGASRDGVMARFLSRDWWRSGGTTLFAHERDFDPLSGILTVRSTWVRGRRSGEREHRIRLHTATRLAELCAAAGLLVEEAYAGWSDRPLGRRDSEMLLVARKRGLAHPRRAR
jgi:SAM-dependent methyltransferase